MKKYLIFNIFIVILLGTIVVISQIKAIEPQELSSRTNLRLFDNNGQYIGTLLSADFSAFGCTYGSEGCTTLRYRIYRGELGTNGLVFEIIEPPEGSIDMKGVSRNNQIQYTEADCNSIPFETQLLPNRHNLFRTVSTTTDETFIKYYYYTGSSSEFIALSQIGYGTGGCINYSEPMSMYGYRLREIAPFTEPFALPLKIK